MEVQNEQSKDEFLKALSSALREKLDENPNLSIQAVANKAGLSYNTVNRVLQQTNMPAMDQVLKLISTLNNEQSIENIICNAPPKIQLALQKVYKVLYKENKESVFSKRIEENLEDQNALIIYTLAANKSGTTYEQIKETLGKIGIAKCNELIHCGMIVEKQNRLYATTQSFATSFKTAKKNIPAYLRFYEPGKENNYIQVLTESVNLKGYGKILDAHQEFHQKIVKIMNSPSYHGDIPIFSVAFTDTIDRDQLNSAIANNNAH